MSIVVGRHIACRLTYAPVARKLPQGWAVADVVTDAPLRPEPPAVDAPVTGERGCDAFVDGVPHTLAHDQQGHEEITEDDNSRKEIMDRDGVLQALEAGEFDGISHDYQPYAGYQKNTTHQLSMSVSGGTIEVTKITRGKFFDGKENTRFEERSPDYLTGNGAADFIEQHPYYFSLARPDLF